MSRLLLNAPSYSTGKLTVRLPTASHQVVPSLPKQAKALAVASDASKPAITALTTRALDVSELEERVIIAPSSSTNLTAWEDEQQVLAQAQGSAEELACLASASVAGEPSDCAVPSSAASCTHSAWNQKDQNSVTIKCDTSVKQAAGAIVKVLDRLCSTIVTALQQQQHETLMQGTQQYEALNRTVKALAVCRKYLTDTEPGAELSFLPVHRSDRYGREDPLRFAFLAFKSSLTPGVQLQTGGEADLHVSSASDPAAVASNIVQTILQQGQAVMKAGGGCALFVAMTAVIRARHMLKAFHAMDVMLVPQWVTEDTRAVLGRESKFLQFNLLPAGLHGVLPAMEGAPHAPAIVPFSAPASSMSMEPALA